LQIEKNINNPTVAKQYLNHFTDEVLNKLEPEHLVYVGYVAHLLEDDLKAFQALAKAMTRRPELKTKSVVQLYYPFRYKDEINTHAKTEEIDPVLVMSLIRQESAFNKNAISRVGARGLMQLMPATARKLDRKLNKKNLTEVNKNLQAGTKYLSMLLKRYDNNIVYALAAYNAGFGNVDAWIKRYKTTNEMVFMDVIPFQETREYVSSILRNYYWYDQLNKDFSKGKIGNVLSSNQNEP
jgi:soluble lytic murein transglycosylase